MYYELYQNFQTMFEGELEKLCRKKNMTQQEYDACGGEYDVCSCV